MVFSHVLDDGHPAPVQWTRSIRSNHMSRGSQRNCGQKDTAPRDPTLRLFVRYRQGFYEFFLKSFFQGELDVGHCPCDAVRLTAFSLFTSAR